MKNDVDSLKLLSKKELEIKFFENFEKSAPKGYTKLYLIKEILWLEKYNKLSTDIQNRINHLVNEFKKTKSVNIKKVRKFEVTTGTKFIREYNGEKHEVIAIEEGFKYKDHTYKTLSAVANTITGTHWNGKKFFGVANG